MSFQAYLDTIRIRTGQTPADLWAYAVWQGYLEDGVLKPEIEPAMIAAHLKRDFGLGQGHAMAVIALFKGREREGGRRAAFRSYSKSGE